MYFYERNILIRVYNKQSKPHKVVPEENPLMNNLTQAIYQQAKELYENKQYRKAELILKKLFHENSHNIYINHLLTLVLIRLNRKMDTIEGHLKNILYLGNKSKLGTQAYLLLGYLYIQKEKWNQAEETLQTLEKKPYKSVQLYSLMGYLHYHQKDYTKAEMYYGKALELSPDNPNSLNGLGCTYLETRKNIEMAHECISKAIAKDHNNYAYLDSMGWYYIVIHKLSRAFRYLKRSLELRWHAVTNRRLQLVKKLFR